MLMLTGICLAWIASTLFGVDVVVEIELKKRKRRLLLAPRVCGEVIVLRKWSGRV